MRQAESTRSLWGSLVIPRNESSVWNLFHVNLLAPRIWW